MFTLVFEWLKLQSLRLEGFLVITLIFFFLSNTSVDSLELLFSWKENGDRVQNKMQTENTMSGPC